MKRSLLLCASKCRKARNPLSALPRESLKTGETLLNRSLAASQSALTGSLVHLSLIGLRLPLLRRNCRF
jgi:hypothetical protein